ncbi:hypothetical protein J6590_067507 [Homalodisca vitripennis]|nr:hypothetical protein J6590_067507 [Homalodisca vitripennis]
MREDLQLRAIPNLENPTLKSDDTHFFKEVQFTGKFIAKALESSEFEQGCENLSVEMRVNKMVKKLEQKVASTQLSGSQAEVKRYAGLRTSEWAGTWPKAGVLSPVHRGPRLIPNRSQVNLSLPYILPHPHRLMSRCPHKSASLL